MPKTGVDVVVRVYTRVYTVNHDVSHAAALISPRFIPISRFDKSICRGRARAPRRGNSCAPPLCLSARLFQVRKRGPCAPRVYRYFNVSGRVMRCNAHARCKRAFPELASVIVFSDYPRTISCLVTKFQRKVRMIRMVIREC